MLILPNWLKQLKGPEATIWNFESESYVKNIFTYYVVSINKAENDICFNVLKKSSFMSFIGLKYSEADNTRSNIANLYPRSTTKYWLSLTEHIYFEQSTKKYWLALTVRIFFVWKVAQLRSFLQRCLFHPEEASILQWKNKTDDIFQVLQKKDGLSNGYIHTEENVCLIKWQVYMHMKHLRSRITKSGWEFSISCIQCFSLPIRWEILFSRFGKRNNSMIRNYSQYGMSLSLESVCLLWIKKYGR